jgi:hypothetical protein
LASSLQVNRLQIDFCFCILFLHHIIDAAHAPRQNRLETTVSSVQTRRRLRWTVGSLSKGIESA